MPKTAEDAFKQSAQPECQGVILPWRLRCEVQHLMAIRSQ